ncbi:MAG: hypothetical protein WAN16_03275 [Chthoniobacterales bacterium]
MGGIHLTPLADALRERLTVIADHAHRDRDQAAHLQRLIDASTRIDTLITALPSGELDPQFRHYLEKKSYDKALGWIQSGGGES